MHTGASIAMRVREDCWPWATVRSVVGAKAAKNARRKAEIAEQVKRRAPLHCGAKKRNGKICKRDAGWGTKHVGYGRCKHHTGATHAGRELAARQQTNQQANGLSVPLANITPGQAITGLMCLAAGQLTYATQKVGELSEDEIFVKSMSGLIPNEWVRLQHSLMRDLSDYAKRAADMGIAERQTSMAEAQTAMLSRYLDAVLGDLDLSDEQRALVGPALRKHLTLVQPGQTVDGTVVDGVGLAA